MPSLAEQPLSALLDELASKQPAPGGGAVAGLTGATACALARMVIAYSVDRPTLVPHRVLLLESDGKLQRAAALFLSLAEEDAEAFAVYSSLKRDAGADPTVLSDAKAAALGAPRATLALAVDVLAVLEPLPGRTNKHLVSDLAIAGDLAASAARAAAWNVRVNLGLADGEASRSELSAELDAAESGAVRRAAAIESACRTSEIA